MTRSLLVLALATLTACGSADMTPSNPVGPCGSPVNGCSTFTDLTAATAVVDFGGGVGLNYVPQCIQVKAGQAITFNGDFGAHPLSQTCGPVDAIPHKSGGSTLTFSIANAGTYGYQCDVHHASGMAGAILVVP